MSTVLRLKFALALLVAVPLVLQAEFSAAAVIAGWDFNGLANGGPSPFSAATTDPGVTVSGLTRQFAGDQANAGANTWGSNNLTTQDAATAIQFNSFFNFAITTTEAGISLSDIGVYNIWLHEYEPGGINPSVFNGLWQYSTDGTNFTDIGSQFSLGTVSQGAGNTQSAVDLTGIAGLQSMPSGTVVDLRLVVWGAGYGANYAGFNSFQAGDDLIVNGTVPVPEPSTLAIAAAGLACGVGGYLRRRRRA